MRAHAITAPTTLLETHEMSEPKIVSRSGVEGPWKHDAHLIVDKITMSDGSKMYGCTLCEATSATPSGISRHVPTHQAITDGQPDEQPQPDTGDHTITIGQVVKALVQVIEPLGDMTLDEFADTFNTSEEWRERALTAEDEVRKIKKVLGLG
jgi:hypothetical protein